MTELTVEERVTRGARALDRWDRSWPWRLNLESLDIASSDRCVLAQLDPRLPESWTLVGYGFDSESYSRSLRGQRECAALTTEWRRAVSRRLGRIVP